MSKKHEESEGPIPVNGDITPITKAPIDQINSGEWDTMSTSDLVEQRNALFNRMNLALSMGQMQLVPMMQRGLNYIDQLIRSRENQDETKLI